MVEHWCRLSNCDSRFDSLVHSAIRFCCYELASRSAVRIRFEEAPRGWFFSFRHDASASWAFPRARNPEQLVKRGSLSGRGTRGRQSKCATSVKLVLKKLDGVEDARVSLEAREATVRYDPAKVTPQKMVETIQARLPYRSKVAPVTPTK
ncbi:MAG: heavy metal-associated domain-containing protein [Thermoanaerobaculia bacterium]